MKVCKYIIIWQYYLSLNKHVYVSMWQHYNMSQIEVVGWMLNLNLNYDNGGEGSIPLCDIIHFWITWLYNQSKHTTFDEAIIIMPMWYIYALIHWQFQHLTIKYI
jgi:hypothetical protein